MHISFNNGFSVITGETGAGKSILVDGISLILGKRADLSVNRDKNKKCFIEGVFDIGNYELKKIFESNELDYDSETILRREISTSGKSRAFINDTPVNLSLLSQIGSMIIDIHSQNENSMILDSEFQFSIIDTIAKNDDLLAKYKSKFDLYKIKSNELEKLEFERTNLMQSIDYNKFVLNEIDSANILSENLDKLETEQNKLSNFDQISNELKFSNELIHDDNIGLNSIILKLKRSLNKISKSSSKFDSLHERISSVMYEILDIGVDVDTELNSLEHNPNKLEDIVTKIDKINTILRKHSLSSIDELINFRNTIESKVSSTESIDLRIQKLKEEIQNYFDDLNSLAEKLHIKRTSVISIFSNDIEAILNDLGMPNAKFNIQIDKTDEHNSNGMNRIDFKFLANKGYDYKSLKNSASGGEISRIMLAVKSIIANYKQLPTIIFDEIDTGVSGEISKKMGLIMKKLGLKIQIFSITHLPQVAAMGQSHFKIYKEDNNGVTVTKMEKLNENNRIVEIANMLEGNNASESAYLHAKQLLN